MDDFYWKEWDMLVLEARQNLEGTCPLLDDEVIIKVDEWIRQTKYDESHGHCSG